VISAKKKTVLSGRFSPDCRVFLLSFFWCGFGSGCFFGSSFVKTVSRGDILARFGAPARLCAL